MSSGTVGCNKILTCCAKAYKSKIHCISASDQESVSSAKCMRCFEGMSLAYVRKASGRSR